MFYEREMFNIPKQSSWILNFQHPVLPQPLAKITYLFYQKEDLYKLISDLKQKNSYTIISGSVREIFMDNWNYFRFYFQILKKRNNFGLILRRKDYTFEITNFKWCSIKHRNAAMKLCG